MATTHSADHLSTVVVDAAKNEDESFLCCQQGWCTGAFPETEFFKFSCHGRLTYPDHVVHDGFLFPSRKYVAVRPPVWTERKAAVVFSQPPLCSVLDSCREVPEMEDSCEPAAPCKGPSGMSFPYYAIWYGTEKTSQPIAMVGWKPASRPRLNIEPARFAGSRTLLRSGLLCPDDAVLCDRNDDALLDVFGAMFWHDTRYALESLPVAGGFRPQSGTVEKDAYDAVKSHSSHQQREIATLKKKLARNAAHLQRGLEHEKARRKATRRAAREAKFENFSCQSGEESLLTQLRQGITAPFRRVEALAAEASVTMDVTRQSAENVSAVADNFNEILASLAKMFSSYEGVNIPDIFAAGYLLYNAMCSANKIASLAALKVLATASGVTNEDVKKLYDFITSSFSQWVEQQAHHACTVTHDGDREAAIEQMRERAAAYSEPEPSFDEFTPQSGLLDGFGNIVGSVGDSMGPSGILTMMASGTLAFVTFMFSGKLPDYKGLSKWFSDFGRMSNGVKSMKEFSNWLMTEVEDIYYQYVCGKSAEEIRLIRAYPLLEQQLAAATFVSQLPLGPINRNLNLANQIIALNRELTELKIQALKAKDDSSVRVIGEYIKIFARQYTEAATSPAKINRVREEPYTIYVASEKSGVGKTYLCTLLRSDIYKEFIKKHGVPSGNAWFTRRCANEFWDGYNCSETGEHGTYYDDFMQLADSTSNPNPEALEVIGIANSEPFHLHMAGVGEKKDCFFRSKYVLFSSNTEWPNPKSLTCPEALRRRMLTGVRVAVRPECGVMSGAGSGAYYKYDEKKTRAYCLEKGIEFEGGLCTTQYLLTVYDVSTGSNISVKGKTELSYDEFTKYLFERMHAFKEEQAVLRRQLAERGGDSIEIPTVEDEALADEFVRVRFNPEKLVQSVADSPCDAMKHWVQTRAKECRVSMKHTFTSAREVIKGFFCVASDDSAQMLLATGDPVGTGPSAASDVGPMEFAHLTDDWNAAWDTENEISPQSGEQDEFVQADDRTRIEVESVLALLQAQDLAAAEALAAREASQFAMCEARAAAPFDPLNPDTLFASHSVETAQVSGVYDIYAMCCERAGRVRRWLQKTLLSGVKWVSEKAKAFYAVIKEIVIGMAGHLRNAPLKSLVCLWVATEIYACFEVSRSLPTSGCKFWQTCSETPCFDCRICSDFHLENDTWEASIESMVSFFSTDAGSAYLGLNEIHMNRLFRWYYRRVTRRESGELKTLQANRSVRAESGELKTLQANMTPRPESGVIAGLTKTQIRPESGKLFERIRCQSDVVYETSTVGSPSSMKLYAKGDLVRIEQSQATVCHNGAIFVFKVAGDNKLKVGVGFFVQGRVALVNLHSIPTKFEHLEIRNPWSPNPGGKIPARDLRITPLTDVQGNPLDLAFIECPVSVASRPSIIRKFATGTDLVMLKEGSLVLDGLKMVQGIPVMVSKRTNSFQLLTGVMPPTQEDHLSMLKGFRYNRVIYSDLETTDGESGSILSASNKLMPSKIVGIHCGGLGAGTGQAIGQPLSRELLERNFARHVATHATPLVNMIDSAIPFSTQSTEEIEMPGVDLPRRGTCLHLGTAPMPSTPTKTKIRKSAISGVFGAPTMRPASLAPYEKDGVRHDPSRSASGKLLNQRPYIDADELKRATAETCKMFGRAPDNYRTVLTLEEAVTANCFEEMTGVRRSTSKGYPSVLKGSCTNKRELLGKDEYVIDPECSRAVEAMIAICKKGVKPPAIFLGMLKDERRPHAKVDADKTRQIYASWVVLLLVQRMYFGGLMAWTQCNRIKNGCAIGVNPYSLEWQKIADHLHEVSDDIVSGDHENYDGQNNSQVIHGLLDIVEYHYKGCPKEDNTVRTVLWDTIANADIIIGGEVVRLDHSQPSGNLMTTWVNCLANIIYHVRIFNHLKKKHGRLDASFSKHVRIVTFGDDVLFSVDPCVKDFFHFGNVRVAFRELFDMNYTLETKGTEDIGFRKLIEVQFLKRSFRLNEYGVHAGPLSIESIHEMVNWIKGERVKDATAVNVQFAVRELYFHGRECFDAHVAMLEEACAAEGIEITVPLWDDFSENWAHENGFGTVCLGAADYQAMFGWEFSAQSGELDERDDVYWDRLLADSVSEDLATLEASRHELEDMAGRPWVHTLGGWELRDPAPLGDVPPSSNLFPNPPPLLAHCMKRSRELVMFASSIERIGWVAPAWFASVEEKKYARFVLAQEAVELLAIRGEILGYLVGCEGDRKEKLRRMIDKNCEMVIQYELAVRQITDALNEAAVPWNAEGDECAVCLEKIVSQVTLLCTHSFCTACIHRVMWGDNPKCPLCRAGLTGADRKEISEAHEILRMWGDALQTPIPTEFDESLD